MCWPGVLQKRQTRIFYLLILILILDCPEHL